MIVVIIVVVAADVRGQTRAICDRCKTFDRWYASPGRAKMALSAHKRQCKKV